MAKEMNGLFSVSVEGHKEAMEVIKKLTDVAQPGTAYGEPVTVGDHTIITTSEVTVGLGFGYAMGGPTEPGSAVAKESEEAEAEGEGQENTTGGFGGGGGGGGGSSARPGAVIHIDSKGVRVEPVVDVTKIFLAFFTMLGSIFLMGAKMRKKAKGI